MLENLCDQTQIKIERKENMTDPKQPDSNGDKANQFLEILKQLTDKSKDQLTLSDIRDYIRIVNYNFVRLEGNLLTIEEGLTELTARIKEFVAAHSLLDDAAVVEKKSERQKAKPKSKSKPRRKKE